MAVNSAQDFSIQLMIGGLLMVCMLAFTIAFMYSNNPNGLGTDADSIFEDTYGNSSGLLLQSSSNADILLNITANTNPEVSDLGSRDSVASGFEAVGNAKNYWRSSKKLIGWVFSGTTGSMLLGVFAGLIGLLSFFFIAKFIRTGN